MSAPAQQFVLAELLTRGGARIRGRRADCPRCKRQRSVAFDETKGVYHCHGQGCDFSGGIVKLARELGLAEQLTPAEYRELWRNRKRSDLAAQALYQHVRARRLELLDRLDVLSGLESTAQGLGPDSPETWEALSTVYTERRGILAELTILENCGAADLLRFLCAGPEERERAIHRVLVRAGVCAPACMMLASDS